MACLRSWRIVRSAAALLAVSILWPAGVLASEVVVRTVMVENEDPFAAGKEAAEKLQAAMGSTPLKAVIVSECFEDRPAKSKLLDGITSVIAKELVYGAATYGSFTQSGCTDFDAVCLLGLGGEGLGVSAHLVTKMGTSRLIVDTDKQLVAELLHKAGSELAGGLRRTDRDRLLVLLADAHSPKNQFLVEGVQQVLGADLSDYRRLCEQERGPDFRLLPGGNVRGQCRRADAVRGLSCIARGPSGKCQRTGNQFSTGWSEAGTRFTLGQTGGRPGVQLCRPPQQAQEIRGRAARDAGSARKSVGTFRVLLCRRNGPPGRSANALADRVSAVPAGT